MLKPFPSNNFFDEKLRVLGEQPPDVSQKRVLTLCTFSESTAGLISRVFTATGRPLNVALYTFEKPPDANGLTSHLMDFGASANEDGRT